MTDQRVTFVVGVAHSGTTILYRLLGRHPALAWFSQFSQRRWDIPGRFPLPFADTYNQVARKLFTIPYRKQRGIGEYLVPRPMEANSIWDHVLPFEANGIQARPNVYTPDDVSDSTREAVREVVLSELDRWNRSHFLAKLPRLSRAVLVLNDIFVDAKFIHLVRDGRAVALSNRHKFDRRSEVQDPLRASALHWKNTVEWLEDAARSRLDDDQFQRLKLETLQDNTKECFRRLLDFLGLSPDRYPFPLPELKSDTNQKWLRRADADQQKMLREALEETLLKFDYDLSFPGS